MTTDISEFLSSFNKSVERKRDPALYIEQITELNNIIDLLNKTGEFSAEIQPMQRMGDLAVLLLRHADSNAAKRFHIDFGYSGFDGATIKLLDLRTGKALGDNEAGFNLKYDSEKFLRSLGAAMAAKVNRGELNQSIKYNTRRNLKG